jgi:hypothetical protein
MRGSITYLRRGLLGAAIVGSLGFGATQALAVPRETVSQDGTCVWGDPGARSICQSYCQANYYNDGACTRKGFCACVGYIGP